MNQFDSSYVNLTKFRMMLAEISRGIKNQIMQYSGSHSNPLAGFSQTNVPHANEILSSRLSEFRPVPVLSSERYPEFSDRRNLDEYWLINCHSITNDSPSSPLDYCVSVALIEGSRPVFSAIDTPSLGAIYWAEEGVGAYVERESEFRSLETIAASIGKSRALLTLGEEADTESIYKTIGINSFVPTIPALTFPALVENEADILLRIRGLNEWDIAPGDLLLREAGGELLSLSTGGSLFYNQQDPRVAAFVATAPGRFVTPAEFQIFRRAAE